MWTRSSLKNEGEVSANALKSRKQHAETLLEDNRLRVLAMLNAVDYEAKHRKLQNLRHAGTGEWLFRHAVYVEWKTAGSSALLCCNGIRKYHSLLYQDLVLTAFSAGCGKSVLAYVE